MPEEFSEAEFNRTLKSVAAMLGIDLKPKTDAFGRTTFMMEREGMLLLQRTAVEAGFPELAVGIQEMLDKGPSVVE